LKLNVAQENIDKTPETQQTLPGLYRPGKNSILER